MVRWHKKEGERVEEEEIIAEIQTEKANIDVPAYQAGTLTRILVPEGETVAVGTPIALLDGEGEAAGASTSPAREPESRGTEVAPAAGNRKGPPAPPQPREEAAGRPPGPTAPEERPVPPRTEAQRPPEIVGTAAGRGAAPS